MLKIKRPHSFHPNRSLSGDSLSSDQGARADHRIKKSTLKKGTLDEKYAALYKRLTTSEQEPSSDFGLIGITYKLRYRLGIIASRKAAQSTIDLPERVWLLALAQEHFRFSNAREERKTATRDLCVTLIKLFESDSSWLQEALMNRVCEMVCDNDDIHPREEICKSLVRLSRRIPPSESRNDLIRRLKEASKREVSEDLQVFLGRCKEEMRDLHRSKLPYRHLFEKVADRLFEEEKEPVEPLLDISMDLICGPDLEDFLTKSEDLKIMRWQVFGLCPALIAREFYEEAFSFYNHLILNLSVISQEGYERAKALYDLSVSDMEIISETLIQVQEDACRLFLLMRSLDQATKPKTLEIHS